ncbi:hypothetical protein HNP55_003560 [Paucibacter oligotrophus]|uniref:Uncharacterized protein n=1 Tax=Roseateles oligotrophus TaxID=1769250 RepID=A0A840L8V6_9BURK|nr:hypothetical protein [Roseateles oligotrophus]MBB4845014.1 hypothetical protein [Roseateles oligotrophus]
MVLYLITFTLRDGSQREHQGLYACGIDAVIGVMEVFPDAKRISARRISQ